MKKYQEYKKLDLSQISKDILKFWQQDKTFEKSISTRETAKDWVFYEGPPSANGMPGIHHVMSRSIKDIFCRFKTLQGYKVKRKAGWDTHGLPIELGVEKSLGITKEDIGNTASKKYISVEDYNKACRTEVMKYTDKWEVGHALLCMRRAQRRRCMAPVSASDVRRGRALPPPTQTVR